VRQPVIDMALAASRALLDEMNGERTPRAEYLFRPDLIVRGSTGAAPDPDLQQG
jgi:DNA-binding LacI/PurR family transcriptional regulator